MIDAAIMPLKEHFSALDDPRAQHSIEHLLLDTALLGLMAHPETPRFLAR